MSSSSLRSRTRSLAPSSGSPTLYSSSTSTSKSSSHTPMDSPSIASVVSSLPSSSSDDSSSESEAGPATPADSDAGDGLDSMEVKGFVDPFPNFLWMTTEEPHRSRRMAILKAHPEVSSCQYSMSEWAGRVSFIPRVSYDETSSSGTGTDDRFANSWDPHRIPSP
jgi:hypothetical protein